ncbi:MAG: hypothetical protein ACKV19_21785 [Verrucomicrobiales bacterium]
MIGLAVSAEACQICLPFPNESLADHILSSTQLVLARENPDKPFTLRPTRTLAKNETTPPALELFLDTSARRQLAFNEDLSLLCGWSDESGEWRRLALYDQALAPVVSDILEKRQNWKSDPESRVRYFAGLLGHEETVLSDLAHLEVARAPYKQVIQFADRLPREELHRRLADLRRIEWHALYILLLAQSEDLADRQFIRDQVESNARYSTTLQTAAWATALVEIDGEKGVRRLTELYLDHSNRTPEEFAAIHAALRVHGDQGNTELRNLIVSTYRKLLGTHPALAPALAEDLTRWQRFDHAGQFADLLGGDTFDLVAGLRLRSHLQAAASARGESPSKPSADHRQLNRDAYAFVGGLVLIPLALTVLVRRKSAASS